MSTHYCLDNSPTFEVIELHTVDSTNNFLHFYQPRTPKEMIVATTEYQSTGKGQRGNSWESEAGQNLLFSIRIHPRHICVHDQFILSQIIALSVKQALDDYHPDISIKWPNDIYAGQKKIAGILIENTLTGKQIDTCIIGVGININQPVFHSGAPNPVSLYQLTGQQTERTFILEQVVGSFRQLYTTIEKDVEKRKEITEKYVKALIYGNEWHEFIDAQGAFRARFTEVEPDGHLVLVDEKGQHRRYTFKEVKHVFGDTPDTPIYLP